MNTIIIHPNNRVARTPEHDLSDILIAPVSRWYRKPTPWWVDKFEEVGLYPIVEADEIAEEREEPLAEIAIEDEHVDLDCEVNACENAEFARTDIAIEQGEHGNVGADIFGDIALGDIIFGNDLHGSERDRCRERTHFFEDVIIVDEVSIDGDGKSEDDDTVMDITFTGEAATFILRLPVQIVEDDEWDEKATLSIIAPELDSEDKRDDDTFYGNHSSCGANQFLQ